jgi:hypothetical protein
MRRLRTGRRLHDPAWHGQDFSRRRHASGNRPTCVCGDHRRRQGPGKAWRRAGKTARTRNEAACPASIAPVPGCDRAIADMSRRSEISIASDRGPRVPSSGTFVRLPAPETLHGSGTSAPGAFHLVKDVQIETRNLQIRIVAHGRKLNRLHDVGTSALARDRIKFSPNRCAQSSRMPAILTKSATEDACIFRII